MSDFSPLRLADNGSSPSHPSDGSQTNPSDSERTAKSKSRKNLNHRKRSNRDHIGVDGDALERSHLGQDGPSQHGGRHHRQQSDTSSTKSEQLRYGARNVIELFIPVSLCMLIVIGTMKATESYKYSSQSVVWYAQVMFTDQSVDTGTRVWQSFANALLMLVMIVIMTTLLILLYKFEFYKVIHGWLIMSSLILLFLFAIMYIAEILKVYNVPLDIYTLMISIWNFGVVGMISIHWRGPLLLQQGYLILISALLALVFIRSLPDWTCWTVLGIVSIWDLVAVLCPRGPLRILVETAQERNEPIFPALIYSSTMMWEVATISMANSDNARSRNGQRPHDRSGRPRQPTASTSSNRSSTSNRNSQYPAEILYEGMAQPPEVDIIQPSTSGTSANWETPVVRAIDGRASSTDNFHPADNQIERVQVVEEEEESGVKLGLGDFIFYSLLVGKASSYNDWVITISCYVAILVGLCVTLSLLAIFRKALPALPISIAFGLCSFFMSFIFASPFAEELAIKQIFI